MRSTSLTRLTRPAVSALLVTLMSSAAIPAMAQGLRMPGQDGGGAGGPSRPSLGSGSPVMVQPPTQQPQAPQPFTRLPAAPAAASSSSSRGPQLADEIVAIVNRDAITRRELDKRLQAARITLSRQNIALPPENVLQRQVLERMIVERTQLQEAADMGIRIDDAQLDRAVGRIAEQNRVTVNQMRDQLERDGVPFADYREDLRREIVMVRARERAVDSQVQVSEAEVDAALQDQAGQAGGGVSQLALAQILVRVPEGSSPDRIAALRAKAEGLRNQAAGPTDFARLAAASSDGEEALRGGDLGTRPSDRWPQLFTDAVARLNAGQVSEVIQSGNGFHILKLVDRKGSSGVPDVAPMPVQQTRARHILIRTTEVLNNDQVRQRLSDIRQRLVNGVSFADMARQYSNDGSAPQGGELGWLSPGETVPEFERVMDGLQLGQISEPVQSPFGWHLIQVEERRTQDVSAERQRVTTRQALRDRKIDQTYEDWARQLRDRAYVEIRLDPPAGG
ncbi:molecular chaperone SurA [Pigmentiphaga aceris]|uniref:Chaperone SurA n=1 Tax=Pigmentiphaga aceris TaxID=1940612 RepID=A0A5C0B688_9BURK|nr:peptidylprolyl isomerase [Pigmentiphaga aceris]QEI08127.1 molecular chaperone SurA [Pigmentiphaga aceris]